MNVHQSAPAEAQNGAAELDRSGALVLDYNYKMSKSAIIMLGFELTIALEQASAYYHVKSGQHECLLWESAIVRAKTTCLQHGMEILENLKKSVLLGAPMLDYYSMDQRLLEQVQRFHQLFEELLQEKRNS